MSKRVAGSQLTHDNWDEEEEAEEVGIFKTADDNVLKGRVIKKAKRKGVSGADSSGTGGAFKGFAGFSAAKPADSSGVSSLMGTSTGKPLFGGIFNGTSAASTSVASTAQSNTQSDSSQAASTATEAKSVSNGQNKSSSRSKYMRQLKALNESVTQWIRDHVEKNPYCILSPIFVDYNKYLDEINSKFPEEKVIAESSTDDGTRQEKIDEREATPTSTAVTSPSAPATASPLPKFTFSKDTSLTSRAAAPSFGSSTSTTQSSGFSFKSLSSGSNRAGSSSSLAGASSSLAGASSSLAGAGGFSFAVGKPKEEPSKEETKGDEEEETYVPPEPEVNVVKEDDAFFTQKCKLFFKKDSSWQEKGVGHLHLKPCGEQTQLLIRADTSLGNILLNIKLTSSLPASRQGKNNVAIVCIPNPPLDEKNPNVPTTMLIRVKTAEDADKLLEQISEHK